MHAAKAVESTRVGANIGKTRHTDDRRSGMGLRLRTTVGGDLGNHSRRMASQDGANAKGKRNGREGLKSLA